MLVHISSSVCAPSSSAAAAGPSCARSRSRSSRRRRGRSLRNSPPSRGARTSCIRPPASPTLPAALIDWMTFSMSASLPGPVVDGVREAGDHQVRQRQAVGLEAVHHLLRAALSSQGMRGPPEMTCSTPSCRIRRAAAAAASSARRAAAPRRRAPLRGKSSACPCLRNAGGSGPRRPTGKTLYATGMPSAAAPGGLQHGSS